MLFLLVSIFLLEWLENNTFICASSPALSNGKEVECQFRDHKVAILFDVSNSLKNPALRKEKHLIIDLVKSLHEFAPNSETLAKHLYIAAFNNKLHVDYSPKDWKRFNIDHIVSKIKNNGRHHDTCTANALIHAREEINKMEGNGEKVVVIATDGQPWCKFKSWTYEEKKMVKEVTRRIKSHQLRNYNKVVKKLVDEMAAEHFTIIVYAFGRRSHRRKMRHNLRQMATKPEHFAGHDVLNADLAKRFILNRLCQVKPDEVPTDPDEEIKWVKVVPTAPPRGHGYNTPAPETPRTTTTKTDIPYIQEYADQYIPRVDEPWKVHTVKYAGNGRVENQKKSSFQIGSTGQHSPLFFDLETGKDFTCFEEQMFASGVDRQVVRTLQFRLPQGTNLVNPEARVNFIDVIVDMGTREPRNLLYSCWEVTIPRGYTRQRSY